MTTIAWVVPLVLATDERAFEIERLFPHAHMQERHTQARFR
jgi:hypothetical protein